MTSEERLARMLGGARGGGNTVMRHCVHGRGVSGSYGGVMGSRSGAVATNNPFRFSTKYADEETGLVHYGYRFYSPTLGRWVSRDPIEEQGGYHLYGFLWNTSINSVDPFGLWWGSPDYDRKEDDSSVARVVKECNIVIYVGDASLMPNFGNEPCSAASTVACDPSAYRSGGPITIEKPLPGWQPIRQPPENIGKPIHAYEGVKTDDTLSPSDAAWLANRDFEVAQDHAKNTICKSKEHCCDEVEINISCEFLNWVNRGAISGYDVCGKSTTVSCE